MPQLIIPPAPRILTGHRTTGFTFERLDRYGNLLGPLEGVVPGSLTLEWSTARSVHGSGQGLTVENIGQSVDWLSDRIRVSAAVTDAAGVTSWPLITAVPDVPDDQWDPVAESWEVPLLDVTALLDRRSLQNPFKPSAGVVTEIVQNLIDWTSLPRAVTWDAHTFDVLPRYETGESLLAVCNDALGRINYFSLYADGNGTVHGDPYQRPQDRPKVWDFIDGETCIYQPAWSRSRDWSSIPTEVVLSTTGTDTDPGMTAYYQAPPDAPASEARRGFAVTYYENVEAPDQATLDALAVRRYHDRASVASKVTIQHMPIPLRTNDVVRFRSSRAGIDALFVVSNTKLTAAAKALATTVLTEVVIG